MKMSRIRYGSHSAHQLLVHFVFVTNRRFPTITKHRETRLKDIFAEICGRLDAELVRFGADNEKNAPPIQRRSGSGHAGGITPAAQPSPVAPKRDANHVHLLVRYSPRHSIATLAQHLKGESSFRLNREEANNEKSKAGAVPANEMVVDLSGASHRRCEPFRWSGMYFAKSVGHIDAATTSTYIANQGRATA